MTAFFRSTDEVFSALVDGSARALPLEAMRKALDVVVPRSDEFGSPLAVQAQSGVLCTIAAMGALRGDLRHAATQASDFTLDAVENFVAFSRERVLGEFASPPSSELVRRERERQLADASFLRSLDEGDARGLLEWRAANREHMIPVAIW